MTADLRQQIRNAIDQQARSRRQAWIDGGELAVCVRCGADREARTPGCKTCADRHRRGEKRANDAYREHENKVQRDWRARNHEHALKQQRAYRASLKSRPAGSSLAVASCKESPVGRTSKRVVT